MLQSMGSQRVGYNLATEQQQLISTNYIFHSQKKTYITMVDNSLNKCCFVLIDTFVTQVLHLFPRVMSLNYSVVRAAW